MALRRSAIRASRCGPTERSDPPNDHIGQLPLGVGSTLFHSNFGYAHWLVKQRSINKFSFGGLCESEVLDVNIQKKR